MDILDNLTLSFQFPDGLNVAYEANQLTPPGFSRVGEDSLNQRRGAYHSAEITFVFGRSHPLMASAGTTSYDSTLAEAMSDYWVKFATSGDPNGAGGGKWPPWPRYSTSTDALLEFGPDIRPRTQVKRATYDSLDAIARSRGGLRP